MFYIDDRMLKRIAYGIDFPEKIDIFAILRWCLLQQRDTTSSIVSIIQSMNNLFKFTYIKSNNILLTFIVTVTY